MKKILIADERVESRLIMKLILKQFPIEIIEAKDGKEAMKKIMKHQPDLTFLDIHMPEKNGFDILTDLKKQGNKMPVVVVSDNREQSIIDSCLDLGALSYIKKPFLINECSLKTNEISRLQRFLIIMLFVF
ncbi:MAG: response regulator, partial [Marinilabiliaceae bacterium]|nr:response regulator [Marinilabiliaceae bacterium]